MSDTPDLSGKLGPFLATMVVAGGMIGSGIFLLPASLAAIGSISLLGWVLAIAGATLIGGVFSFLAVLRPKSAGLFAYIGEALGPGVGFVCGAVYWTLCWVGSVAIALAATGYLSVFVPAVARPPGATFATLGVLWLFVGANMVGPRFVARLGGWTLFVGLAPVVLVAIFGWWHFRPSVFIASWNVSHASGWNAAATSAVIAFWAFLGVEYASIIAPLVRHPARSVPIATLGGLAIAGVVYVSSCAVIMGILPAGQLARSSAPFAEAAMPWVGGVIAGAVAFCAMLKACGAVGVSVLTTAETARSDAVLGQIGRRDDANQIRPPTRSLLLIGALMSLLTVASANPSLGRQFTIIADVTVVLSMLVYVAAALALYRISREATGRTRLAARICAAGAALFAGAMIAVSEADLLLWSAAAVVIAVATYALLRRRTARRSDLRSPPAAAVGGGQDGVHPPGGSPAALG